MLTWHPIALSLSEISFGPCGLAEVEVGGKKICLVNHPQGLRACSAKCPHAGASMVEGWLDSGGNLVCPLHRYRFSLLNGRNVSGEGYFLKSYPIEVREDGIYVGIEENTGFWSR